MRQVKLAGSYLQMGRMQGLSFSKGSYTPPKPERAMLHFARQCAEIIGQYAPELLEELRGLAEGARFNYEALLVESLTAPFDLRDIGATTPAGPCTVVWVAPEHSADGRPLVGRNYDYFHDVSEKTAATYAVYPEGRYASLGNCDIWIGREDGMNEAGLFVGQARIWMQGLKPGFTFWFMVRLLLDRCATVAEGLDLIQRLPHAASWTYLLADAAGKAVVVEPTIDGIELRYPINGLLVATNHAVCPRWQGKERFVPPDSHPRYHRLFELLGNSSTPVDVTALKAALRDHEGQVCSHGVRFYNRFGTPWSLVGRPGERKLEIAAGHPCKAEYNYFNF
jgi:hypothetical protein